MKIQPSQLLSRVGLSHAVSNVTDGNMSLKWGSIEEVVPSREKFIHSVGLTLDSTIGCRLDGETGRVEVLDRAAAGRGMRSSLTDAPGDGVIVTEKNIGVFMFSGDCPIALLYDPQKKVLGMVHLSRGTSDKGIAASMVMQMQDCGSSIENILIWIGPGIKKESYLYDSEPKTQMDWSQYYPKYGNSIGIDLFGFNKDQFLQSGILSDHIELSEIDTGKDPEYFSHSRSFHTGSHEGRFATIAVMR